jgi:hypothetical protein
MVFTPEDEAERGQRPWGNDVLCPRRSATAARMSGSGPD